MDGVEHLQDFIATEGEHWLAQIARTGLGNNSARSELIARTEVARAINSAAIQCYRDHGITHKHLGLSPGACQTCEDAAEDGDIPLDAPFSAGGVLGNVHPGCRCVPLPSGVNAEPPLAHLGKSAADDESRLVWLLLRARDEDGKWRFLLQQRPDGTWGMPGGKPHVGEDPWKAALREVAEEIGAFPSPQISGTYHHVEDDGKTQVYLWLCTVPYFHPTLDGSTPEETRGAAWFRRKEIAGLDLAPKFREDWETGISLKEHVTKALQRMVNENGETLTLTPVSQALQAVGSRWPYPHRADGAEWPDSGPGNAPGAMGASEPPHWSDDMAEPEPHDTLEPRGGDDGKMPTRGRKPAPPAEVFPNQGYAHDEAWPQPQTTLTPARTPVGARTGVPPSGEKRAKVSKASVNYRAGTDARHCGNCVMFHPRDGSCDLVKGEVHPRGVCDRWEAKPAEKTANDSGHPVVGSVPAKIPKPYRPHVTEPEAFDPGDTVEEWSPEAGSNVVHDAAKGAQHVTDANPVEWRHVYACMESNFPDKSLEWVKHSTWVGPVHVPWSRVDADDIDSWAASHQPEAVQRFAKEIARGGKHTEPSILVHQANHPDGREIVIDGHHRAMARHFKLGKPVLAYVGTVPARWMKQALETHSSQLHSGSDPANKSEQTPVVSTVHHPLGEQGLWHTPDRHSPERQQLPAYIQNAAHALMRDEGMEESRAIATAINAVKEWAQGRAFGGRAHVTDEVRQAAQRALREWEDLKASHHRGD